MSPLDRMISEDAAALAHVATARRQARTDIRRAAVMVTAVAYLAVGYAMGYAMAPDQCTPDQDGCRFTDGAQVLQTHQGVTWPVCRAESSDGPCLWDASRDGNGHGRSFTVAQDGTVTYL